MTAVIGRPEGRPEGVPRPSGIASLPPLPQLEGLSAEERQEAVREHQVAIDLWKLHVATMTELGKVGAEAARLAVSQVLVVNAGAAVALLTLFGNVAGRGSSTLEPVLPELGMALLAYACGATLAVLTSGSAVLSHNAAVALRPGASARWRVAAQALFGSSLLAFGLGTALAAAALLAGLG